ncbi:unnamed protein product [Caenorhabditis sp. 36 PRJEB53466]|nr:unnamed protein product [Caenorhabditis sp. 36 PRJEB53466]
MYLLLVGFSMTLFATYGLSIFEYLNAGKYYALTGESVTIRSRAWEVIHEFGVCLQSTAMLLFSIERFMANRYPRFYHTRTFLFLIHVSIVLSILFSLGFSLSIHVYEQLIPATFLMSLSDYLGLFILVSAWRSSKTNYRLSAGIATLNRRYQMSEVYSWTSTLLPAVVGASLFKVLSMIPIWTWLLLNLTDWEYGIANFLFNNILNAYVAIFPWMLIFRNSSLRKQILSKKGRVEPDKKSLRTVKTLEGKEIPLRPSQNEYFVALQASWNN